MNKDRIQVDEGRKVSSSNETIRMERQVNNVINNKVTDFIINVRKGLQPLTNHDLKVEIVLAVLEARLNKLNDELSEGLDAEEAFRLTMRTMDKAIDALTEIMGVSARLAVSEAILATGIANERNHQAIAA